MLSQSLYRDIILRAWNTTRNNVHFWILGFLAAFLGNGGELEFILTQFNRLSTGTLEISEGLISAFGTGGSNIIRLVSNLFAPVHDNLPLIILLGVILFALVWLAVSAQGAIIRAIALSGGMDRTDLSEHFFKGSSSFFSLLAIILTTRLGAFFAFAVIGIPIGALMMYFLDPWVAGVLAFFIVGVPFLIIASLISKYAIAYHMLDRKSWKSSIIHALQLFADNWLISIELAIIVFIINILAGAVIILLIVLFSVPFILLASFLQDNYQNITITLLWVGEIVAFVALLLFGSILATFQYACWTELFLKIRKHGHLSKIMRIVLSVRDKYR
ncbi:DUF4349 domain-containing protein [Patescibacteria group bacterium]|nr:DUF4349 domain-containing protein [Patescibacteria group bacterium]